jgi:Transposase DDE domain group 1
MPEEVRSLGCATCRSTSSTAGTCWPRSCGGRTSTPPLRRGRSGARIVVRIRRRGPKTRILLRGDSGFAREVLMAWCEANRVDNLFGLARNARLEETVKAELIAPPTKWSEAEISEITRQRADSCLRGQNCQGSGRSTTANLTDWCVPAVLTLATSRLCGTVRERGYHGRPGGTRHVWRRYNGTSR